MKPEHFIYKSDGLYYMQNVPVIPFALESCDCPGCKYAKMAYNEALERAKAEAVKVESLDDREAIGYLILLKYNETKEGEIYTINMEEKIEVYKAYRSFDGVMWGEWIDVESYSVIDQPGKQEYKTFAKIIPKKEEESESQMEMLYELLSNYREHLQDRKNGSNKPLDDFMSEELEKFEIKRRPL